MPGLAKLLIGWAVFQLWALAGGGVQAQTPELRKYLELSPEPALQDSTMGYRVYRE